MATKIINGTTGVVLSNIACPCTLHTDRQIHLNLFACLHAQNNFCKTGWWYLFFYGALHWYSIIKKLQAVRCCSAYKSGPFLFGSPAIESSPTFFCSSVNGWSALCMYLFVVGFWVFLSFDCTLYEYSGIVAVLHRRLFTNLLLSLKVF